MDKTTPTILIDAYSQIFRVFYAIRYLSRKDGFPTNALFGFARLLMQLENDYAPASGAMFFDCGKPAFRLELAPEYKSNRPPMPEELKKQMPLLRELATLFGWQICECTNYEADDLIGAAVKSGCKEKFAIISSDKDLSQLIDDKCFMLLPARSGGGFEIRTGAETFKKFSVIPGQIVDYLSLLGDSSDVIEGVPGIGPKTAASILEKSGSLENFFARPELLENEKLRTKLLENRDRIERNIKLVTLRTQWPENELGNVEKYLVKRAPDWQKIADFAREYELKSVLKDIPADFCRTAVEPPPEVEKIPAGTAAEASPEEDLFRWSSARNDQDDEKTVDRTSAGSALRQDTLF